MLFKKLIVSLFLIPSFLLGIMPMTASADTIASAQHRLELLEQIQKLMAQVVLLQKQLEGKPGYSLVSSSVIQNRTPYQLQFYNFPHEAIYYVDEGKLVNSDPARGVGNIAQGLFNLFKAVVGEQVVQQSVNEWRIFNNKESDIGAYVELMATTENGERNWVVGVNREGFDISSTKSFANLFVHEYGHVLLYDYKDFVNNFKDSFWTAEDIRHQERVVKTSGDKRFSLTKDYYEDNKQRFVSDYATNSFDEDLAETFVYFIREDKPIGNTIRDQKIRTFYQESDLVEKRTQIRANLRGLGVL